MLRAPTCTEAHTPVVGKVVVCHVCKVVVVAQSDLKETMNFVRVQNMLNDLMESFNGH